MASVSGNSSEANELGRVMCRSILPLTVLVFAAACHPSPVAKHDVDVPAGAVGDAVAADGDERERRAAVPAPADGMAWRWNATTHSADFGVPPTGVSLSIRCAAGRLVLRRVDPAPSGARGTMSFTGNGRVASLPAAATARDAATQSSLWQAESAPSDATAAVARVFDGLLSRSRCRGLPG